MLLIKKIKYTGIRRTFKLIADRILSRYVSLYHHNRWIRITHNRDYLGINYPKRKIPIIISITSFPARINTVHFAIRTLLSQTVKPDEVILWLAYEQFENRENDLPDQLLELKEYGLTIKWCHDIKSYKKLIPALKEFPDAFIVTADDDLFYHPKMLERLLIAYSKDNDSIHCHRVTKIYMDDNNIHTVPGGYEIYNHPSFLHKLTGGSGVLYPPGSLYKDVCKEELFMSLAPTNDDIWFWIMAILKGKRCNVVKHSCTALYYINNSQNESLTSINDNGDYLFFEQLNQVLDYYPQAFTLLLEEWNKEGSR